MTEVHHTVGRTLLVELGEVGRRVGELHDTLHLAQGSADTGNQQDAADNVLATTPGRIYTDASNLVALRADTVANVGGSQAHLNMQPFLTLSFCIALQGIFPSAT